MNRREVVRLVIAQRDGSGHLRRRRQSVDPCWWWHLESQRLDSDLVRYWRAILLCDHSEATAVIPHVPTDAVLFQRFSHIGNPSGTILGSCGFAVDSEFVACHGHVVAFG